jgi:hypothetical protein
MDSARLTQIADCAVSSFKLQLGDLDALNLALFAGYVLATLLAFAVLWKRPFPETSTRRETLLWVLAALVLVFLTANKELDLQGWISATGRCLARIEGWYKDRRLVQLQFIRILLVCTLAFAIILFLAIRGTLARNALPFLGFVLLVAFIGLRAISIHHVDHFLRIEFASIRLHRLVEASGLILIIWGEIRILFAKRRPLV